ncbi:chorismate mutase [Mycoplasmatota bacterium WC44]
MDALIKLRNQIDSVDEEIMSLLEKRFRITNEVGIYKKNNMIQVNHSNREDDILSKCVNFNYQEELKEIYLKIFEVSKNQQRG